jgi:hypothetical protein
MQIVSRRRDQCMAKAPRYKLREDRAEAIRRRFDASCGQGNMCDRRNAAHDQEGSRKKMPLRPQDATFELAMRHIGALHGDLLDYFDKSPRQSSLRNIRSPRLSSRPPPSTRFELDMREVRANAYPCSNRRGCFRPSLWWFATDGTLIVQIQGIL